MPALTLSATERRTLRADAHHLSPVVQVGADGLTEAVIKACDEALGAHGLIKVRVFSDDRTQRESVMTSVCDRLDAAAVQHIGKLLVLWRPPTDKSAAPAEAASRGPGPRVVKVVKFSKSGNHRATVHRVKVMGNERITDAGLVKRRKTRQSSVKKKTVAD
jgi:putative YhbY family RNA-binding protein